MVCFFISSEDSMLWFLRRYLHVPLRLISPAISMQIVVCRARVVLLFSIFHSGIPRFHVSPLVPSLEEDSLLSSLSPWLSYHFLLDRGLWEIIKLSLD